jgi:hypothetical protein
MNMTTTERAVRLVEAAGQAGGIDEVRRLATYGWPHDRELDGDSYELRCAIQDEAKRIEASLD